MIRYLITGGSGSLGHALVEYLLTLGAEHEQCPSRIVVYSRDEAKHAAMAQRFGKREVMRYFIGDIRDRDRLTEAMQDIDVVIHAAALKRVDALEYNPEEGVATNIIGAVNVRVAAKAAGVQKVLGVSTDKSSQPVNLYGATKLCMEKLFVAGNAYSGGGGPIFSCVRYGNVAGSRGSVIPVWQALAEEGRPLPVTDVRMTRYFMAMDDAVALIMRSLRRMQGGEIFIPHLKSFKLTDLALAIGGDTEAVGMRPGEKLHESLIGPEEAHNAYDLGDDYCLAYTIADEPRPRIPSTSRRVPEGFVYSSDTNDRWLTVAGLRDALDTLNAKGKRAA